MRCIVCKSCDVFIGTVFACVIAVNMCTTGLETLKIVRVFFVMCLLIRTYSLDASGYVDMKMADLQFGLLFASLCVAIAGAQTVRDNRWYYYKREVFRTMVCITGKCIMEGIGLGETLLSVSLLYPVYSASLGFMASNYNIFIQSAICLIWVEGGVLFVSWRYKDTFLSTRNVLVLLCSTLVFGELVLFSPLLFMPLLVQPFFRLPEALVGNAVQHIIDSCDNTHTLFVNVSVALSCVYVAHFLLTFSGVLDNPVFKVVVGESFILCGGYDIQMFLFVPLITQIGLCFNFEINNQRIKKLWTFLICSDRLFVPLLILGKSLFSWTIFVTQGLWGMDGIFSDVVAMILTYSIAVIVDTVLDVLFFMIHSKIFPHKWEGVSREECADGEDENLKLADLDEPDEVIHSGSV